MRVDLTSVCLKDTARDTVYKDQFTASIGGHDSTKTLLKGASTVNLLKFITEYQA